MFQPSLPVIPNKREDRSSQEPTFTPPEAKSHNQGFKHRSSRLVSWRILDPPVKANIASGGVNVDPHGRLV